MKKPGRAACYRLFDNTKVSVHMGDTPARLVGAGPPVAGVCGQLITENSSHQRGFGVFHSKAQNTLTVR